MLLVTPLYKVVGDHTVKSYWLPCCTKLWVIPLYKVVVDPTVQSCVSPDSRILWVTSGHTVHPYGWDHCTKLLVAPLYKGLFLLVKNKTVTSRQYRKVSWKFWAQSKHKMKINVQSLTTLLSSGLSLL